MKRKPLIISGVNLGAVRPAGHRQVDTRTGRTIGRFTGVAQSSGAGSATSDGGTAPVTPGMAGQPIGLLLALTKAS